MVQKIIIGIIGVVLLGAIGAYFFRDSIPFLSGIGETPVNSAKFVCDQEKTIDAVFYESRVALTLSDFRNLELPQAISASGARYANEDESIVFWNKGDTAFITENGAETFSNCEVEVAGQEARSTYASSTMGVSFKYPKSFTLKTDYQYTGVPNKPVSGIKVLIPETMATGTNLSYADTGVSVEQLPRALNCSADIYFYQDVKASSMSDNGTTYSVASTTDAAAGNRYEEIVYALPGTKPCTAVRYFVHYGNIDNYPSAGEAGAVREFDRDALLAEFDKIRASIVLTPVASPVATSTVQ